MSDSNLTEHSTPRVDAARTLGRDVTSAQRLWRLWHHLLTREGYRLILAPPADLTRRAIALGCAHGRRRGQRVVYDAGHVVAVYSPRGRRPWVRLDSELVAEAMEPAHDAPHAWVRIIRAIHHAVAARPARITTLEHELGIARPPR